MATIIDTLIVNQYVRAIVVFIGFFLIAKLSVFISEKIILRITSKTKTNVDDLIVQKTNKPVSLILVLIGLRLALLPLKINETIEATTQRIILMFIIILIAYIIDVIIGVFINAWAERYSRRTHVKLDVQVIRMFHRFQKILIYILALLFVLQHWGIQITPLLTSLGVAGIAVAFALQATLANVFGGIGLIMDRTIKIGDIVKLDTGESGVVHDIGIRSTKIKTFDNDIVTIPNGKLVDSRITNISQPDASTRVTMEFGVAYGSDPDKVKKIALDCLKGVKHILKEPAPDIWFVNMGDFAMQFKFMFRVDDIANKWAVHQEIITKLYKSLNKNKITIPYPTRTIYMHNKK
jgi:MscS family membrane protein